MRRWLCAALAVALSVLPSGVGQFDSGSPNGGAAAYDGRFTFVRLRWGADLGVSRRGGFSAAWNHDYPRSEQHLSLILDEVTSLDIHTDRSLILTLDRVLGVVRPGLVSVRRIE